jgi:iron complex transport system ATP-binding protein
MRGADEIAVLENGCIRMQGTPNEVYESGILDEVFDIRLRRFETERGNQYYYD